MRLLLQHGTDPNATDEKGRTSLHISIERRNDSKSLTALLLEAGSDPNKKNQYGRTPLIEIIALGLPNMVTVLLKAAGIDWDAKDVFGRSAHVEATRRKRDGLLKLILQDCRETQPVVLNDFTNHSKTYRDRCRGICRVFCAVEMHIHV